jgi:MFS family permease
MSGKTLPNVSGSAGPALGLRQNLAQFMLLVAVNALVGGTLGQERTVLPLLASQTFHLDLYTSALTYIFAFGLSKAAMNDFAGTLSDRYGRKPVLIAGWLAGRCTGSAHAHPRPILGLDRGGQRAAGHQSGPHLDLVGPKRRGLAMGFNEAAGYLGVAGTALVTGYLAATYGLRPAPFLLGAPTSPWALDCGLAWGLFPVLFASAGLNLGQIGILAAAYPAAWGAAQLVTGAASDRWGRKWFITTGMLVQAAALAVTASAHSLGPWLVAAIVLGLGTAMVYPTLLAAIGDVAHPAWRARSVGVYRLWRDGGFAVGAVRSGVLADLYSIPTAIVAVAALTAVSGVVVAVRMRGNDHA